MFSDDEELDPLTSPRNSFSQQSLGNFVFPRNKMQKFLPLAGTPSRSRRTSGVGVSASFGGSFGGSFGRPDFDRQRSSALLDRTHSPRIDWEKYRKEDDELKGIKKKNLRKFYKDQNCLIDEFLAVDEILDSAVPRKIIHYYHRHSLPHAAPSRAVTFDEETPLFPIEEFAEDESSSIVNWAILINFLANVLLLIAKLIVALTSSSLSVLASLVDSVLDFASTVIIFTVSRIVHHNDWRSRYQFPVGKARLEPLGVLCFSVIMIVSFIQVCLEAVQRLVEDGETHSIVTLNPQGVVILSSTVVVKFGCWLWCRSIKNSGVQALAQDAMNDVVFNLFSLIFPVIGQLAKIWWLDPVGAILISIYIILEWVQTAYAHIRNLTGTVAPKSKLQQIVYMASRFSDRIQKVMHVSGYHAGDNILVEVDLVLDKKTPLTDVHDLGEALQYSIESLEGVERAFVHCDYKAEHPSGHIRGR